MRLNNPRYANLINIGFRGLTLVSKFLLIFFLVKFLEPKDVGVYGLLTATIGYGIYLVGLEFYTYSARELITADNSNRASILINQFLVYLFWYLLVAPILFIMAAYEILPKEYLLWIFVLLTFEHLAQELNRILVSLSQQMYAGFVLFVRMGLWGLVVIVVQWFLPETRSVQFVLIAWLIGSVVACGLAVKRLSTLVSSWDGAKIDVTWIALGLKVALPLFLASVAVRSMATLDRYFVEDVAGLEVLGAYVLFVGMSTAVISFIDAGVVDFAYPKLVSAARSKNFEAFTNELTNTKYVILVLGGFLIVACGLGGYFFVQMLDKDVYRENLYVLYWLLFSTLISIASIIPHLGLYSLNKDRAIVQSQVVGFFVFLFTYILLMKSYGLISILIALCAGWGCIFAWKAVAFKMALLKINH